MRSFLAQRAEVEHYVSGLKRPNFFQAAEVVLGGSWFETAVEVVDGKERAYVKRLTKIEQPIEQLKEPNEPQNPLASSHRSGTNTRLGQRRPPLQPEPPVDAPKKLRSSSPRTAVKTRTQLTTTATTAGGDSPAKPRIELPASGKKEQSMTSTAASESGTPHRAKYVSSAVSASSTETGERAAFLGNRKLPRARRSPPGSVSSGPQSPVSQLAAGRRRVVTNVKTPDLSPGTGEQAASPAFSLPPGVEADLIKNKVPVSSVVDVNLVEFLCVERVSRKSVYMRAIGGPGNLAARGYLPMRVNSGTFCTVYRGRYLGREVAIKCPDETLLKTDGEMMRFRAFQEWRLLSRADHPNVLKLIGVAMCQGQVWLLTEYIQGGDLYSLLYRKPPDHLKPHIRLSLMEQLCDALAYLHSCTPKIAHKDIKCNNLLVDETFRLKVCDFGDAEEVHGKFLQCCTAATWQYTPPELIMAENPARPEGATELVDVWAMGCVFLEIMRCPTPFVHILDAVPEEEQRNTLRKLYFSDKLKRMCRIPKHIPSKIRKLIEYCLAFDLHKRPTSLEVIQLLQANRESLLNELKHWQANWEAYDRKEVLPQQQPPPVVIRNAASAWPRHHQQQDAMINHHPISQVATAGPSPIFSQSGGGGQQTPRMVYHDTYESRRKRDALASILSSSSDKYRGAGWAGHLVRYPSGGGGPPPLPHRVMQVVPSHYARQGGPQPESPLMPVYPS